MLIDMYEQPLCQPLFHRAARQPFTKTRQAEVQASYYLRRGWFLNKKRALFKLIGLKFSDYAHIATMEDLDAFASQYLADNYQLEIPTRQTLFLMKCVKHSRTASPPGNPETASPANDDLIITDPQINEPIEPGSASPDPANGLLAQPFPKVGPVQD